MYITYYTWRSRGTVLCNLRLCLSNYRIFRESTWCIIRYLVLVCNAEFYLCLLMGTNLNLSSSSLLRSTDDLQDLLMDWSFLKRQSPHHLLRPELIYTNNPMVRLPPPFLNHRRYWIKIKDILFRNRKISCDNHDLVFLMTPNTDVQYYHPIHMDDVYPLRRVE